MKTCLPFTLIFLFVACSQDPGQPVTDFENIPTFEPEGIRSSQSIDTLYYSYLGINSFVAEEDIILPVWDPTSLVRSNADLDRVIAKTQKGQGPGELQDIGVPSQDKDGNILVYDQFQAKFSKFDQQLKVISESIMQPYGEWRIYRIFPTTDDSRVFVNMLGPFEFTEEMNENEELIAIYDSESEAYTDSMQTFGKVRTPSGQKINGRYMSARQVPFSRKQLITNIPESGTMLLYDTGMDIIAEVDVTLDTLRTIKVNLPTEPVSQAELDSIQVSDELSDADMRMMEDRMPDMKASASEMKYYDGQIWLKSNIKAGHDIWFVINMEGEVIKKVLLPPSSYLTHISDEHLGVRLDAVTFALYEPLPEE